MHGQHEAAGARAAKAQVDCRWRDASRPSQQINTGANSRVIQLGGTLALTTRRLASTKPRRGGCPHSDRGKLEATRVRRRAGQVHRRGPLQRLFEGLGLRPNSLPFTVLRSTGRAGSGSGSRVYQPPL